MSVEDVRQAVIESIGIADEFENWFRDHEATARHAVVDPVLWALGWSTWLPWECLPEFKLDNRGRADYALFGPDGKIAILIEAGTWPGRRNRDRIRLERLARGLRHGVAVLTYGSRWEIYDLSVHALRFGDKRVASVAIHPDAPDAPERCAQTLHRWLRKDLWWRRPVGHPKRRGGRLASFPEERLLRFSLDAAAGTLRHLT